MQCQLNSETRSLQQSAELTMPNCRTLPYRVVFCTNLLPPYRLAVLKVLADGLRAFTVLVSTAMEAKGNGKVGWDGLHVMVQRCWSIRTSGRHPLGFSERLTIHLPYDTPFLLYRLRPDVVISAEMGVRTVLSALYCALRPACRLVIWCDLSEGTEAGRGRVRIWLRRGLLRCASAVLVNGASGRQYVESLGGHPERIRTVPYATDVDLFLRLPVARQPAARRRLLCVGRLIPSKGITPFLGICARWCREHASRNLEICFVGEGELRSGIAEWEPPVNMTVRIQSAVQYRNMPEVYQTGGVLVLPTLADTWALVVNEAMASGLPVLGSVHSQAVDEMVSEGVNGWRFRSDDAEDSYRALCRAMDCSDQQLESMGRSARETASAIGPELVAGLVMQALDSVSACQRITFPTAP